MRELQTWTESVCSVFFFSGEVTLKTLQEREGEVERMWGCDDVRMWGCVRVCHIGPGVNLGGEGRVQEDI